MRKNQEKKIKKKLRKDQKNEENIKKKSRKIESRKNQEKIKNWSRKENKYWEKIKKIPRKDWRTIEWWSWKRKFIFNPLFAWLRCPSFLV